ncbi:MAG: ATP-binding cassette domain-containing protein, partial [Synergistaceae bacterium]|nr:ATP-binding cassette domain-containing protein [Synergistaceae bacterium]
MSLYVKIRHRAGKFRLDVEFETGPGVMGLLGASGCGKSMTLKCIAGVIRPDEGVISYDGRVFFDSRRKINLPPQVRGVGLLFQNCALFPNMTLS